MIKGHTNGTWHCHNHRGPGAYPHSFQAQTRCPSSHFDGALVWPELTLILRSTLGGWDERVLVGCGCGMAATATASGVWQGWRRQAGGACQDTNDGTCSLCGCSSQQAVGRSTTLTSWPGLLGLGGALLGDRLGPCTRVLTGCLPDHCLHGITRQRVSALPHHPCIWCMIRRSPHLCLLLGCNSPFVTAALARGLEEHAVRRCEQKDSSAGERG